MPDDSTPPRTPPSPELVAAANGLIRERLRFGVPVAAIGLGFYLATAALAGFTGLLAVDVAGPVSATLLLLMLVVPLVWGLTLLYRRRADRWDARAAEIRAEYSDAAPEDLR